MQSIHQTCKRFSLSLAAITAGVLIAANAWAGELPIGEPIDQGGMQILGVYLQPVDMQPSMPDQDATKTDIHLEADIHATADNGNGFPEGAWMPYLSVDYKLTKKGSDWSQSGHLHPMVANDGPHYGSNVKLDGPGAYNLTLNIKPPSTNGFMRHTDKETGVDPWWKPITYKGEFKFVGVGKKGGY